jgi:ATP/maltotriose-dependent transcriptional regulator MalT
VEPRQAAHDAFGRRDWQAAYDAFANCPQLDGSDYDAFAEAAWWIGRSDEAIDSYNHAHRLYVDGGSGRQAAVAAFKLAILTRLRGDAAQSDGWLSRAQRLLGDEPEGPEHGYPLYLQIAALMGQGDLDAAIESAQRMQELGRRHGDATLVAVGVFFEGRSRIKQARVKEGLALLDEAMVTALSDELSPFWTGAIYCGLMDACHELVDLRRAREWTDATRRWCEPLPVTNLYPGICRVHQAQVLQVQGSWDEAEVEAAGACEAMLGVDVFAVADGYYELGEVRRLRGNLTGADEAYEKAHEYGRDPQPGCALLRLAQGRVDAAATSIAAALAASSGSDLERAPLHAAQAQIALAAGDLELAERSAAELARTAASFDSPGLRAAAHRTTGAVHLSRGQTVSALPALRMSCQLWQELDAPYEVARTRVLLADAYEALGDEDAATRERNAARAAFARLGATLDARALAPTTELPNGLTEREAEVVRLIAAGLSNRAIATELSLSEKTVARHVSNIFTKTGMTSRSAVAGFAFSNGLVGTG